MPQRLFSFSSLGKFHHKLTIGSYFVERKEHYGSYGSDIIQMKKAMRK